MLCRIENMKSDLSRVLASRYNQGYDTAGMQTKLERLPESMDALVEFSAEINDLPLRKGWKYEEPDSYDEIVRCRPAGFPSGRIGEVPADRFQSRLEAAFLASVAGCILGKPIEVDPVLDELKLAAEAHGLWPLNDYITLGMLDSLGRKHRSYVECCRENIRYVAPDDDLNYTILGLMVLEKHGANFSRVDLAKLWLDNLPLHATYGSERRFLLKAGAYMIDRPLSEEVIDEIRFHFNPEEEACGAAIRVDSYGFAAAGMPFLAARMAFTDSSMDHRRTGVYASMFIAAAIAAAPVAAGQLEIFEIALCAVPEKSRFAETVRDALAIVRGAKDWESAYREINRKYGQYRHCQLYQECAQLINTAKFSSDANDAICIQAMQGCDTDCFAKIAGAVMGCYFGPGSLEDRWIEVFNDEFRVNLGCFFEQSLSMIAKRIGMLPELIR